MPSDAVLQNQLAVTDSCVHFLRQTLEDGELEDEETDEDDGVMTF